jgi:hypothetical protein
MDTDPEDTLAKPSRRYTKRLTVANNGLAWLAIGAAMWLGRDMAGIVVPLMVVLIASLLGIYQGVGHFDLRALATLNGRRASAERKPRRKTEEPVG